MNKDNTDLASPKQPDWYWWKALPSSPPTTIHVNEADVKHNKFKNWGGEWHRFPSFDDVIEHRMAYYDLYKRAKANEVRNVKNEETMKEMVDFILVLSGKTFVPKKEIKEFLEKIQKQNSTPESLPQ